MLFLANARMPPSPPLAVAVATVPLSPRRSAQKLRPVPLLLLAELPDVRSPWSAVVDLIFNLRPWRSPATLRPLRRVPELADDAIEIAVSSFTFPLFSRARACSLAPIPPAAESFSPPAMV